MAVTNQDLINAWAQAEATGDFSKIGSLVSGISPETLQSTFGLSQADTNYIFSRPGVSSIDTTSVAAEPATSGKSTRTWDQAYSDYGDALRSGDVSAGKIKDLYGNLSSDFTSNIIKIKSEIDAQKKAGTADYWGAGNLASPDSAAWDAAFRLAEKGVGSLYDLKQVDGQTVNAKTNQPLEGFGNAYNYDLDYNLQFSPEGVPVLTASNQQSDWVSKYRPAAQALAQVALAASGAGGLLGGALGLSGTAANVAGGALLGGGGAALTGRDVATGALLGGASGYLSGAMATPQDSIYSLANGPSNLDYMGGGQGLTSTGAANLASMGGAQGLQILSGLPSATLADALSSFGGVNPSVLADMGLGTGITYVTPSGIVTENGTIIGGDVISELGKNTGFDLPKWLNENVGVGIGDELAKIDTGIGTGIGTGAGTGAGTSVPAGIDTGAEVGAGAGITVPKLLDAAKIAAIVGGVTGAAKSGTPSGGGFDIVPVPSDWRTPTYSQAPYQPLTPIDFGSRELLRGTQWEKFLNPVQPPVVQPAQTGMGYNQLMNTLQGGQGGNLSLNDIISGIQGQYGQTPSGTVG